MARPKFSYKEYSEQLEKTLAGVRAKNRALKDEIKALKLQLPEPTEDHEAGTYDWSQHMPEFKEKE